MAGNIYALLVGVTDYTDEIGKLTGCVNDVKRYEDYLKSTFKGKANVVALTNADATRKNVIKQFQTFLTKAKEGDVALFQYAGHGAQWKASSEFLEFYPDGKDEGLVLFDSRHNGEFDLADKEIAVLLAGVAANNPHLAVILDCCHSGSGTRDVGAKKIELGLSRQTHERTDERPLDSYLAGHYANMLKKENNLFVPKSEHVLLAACDRKEKAWETNSNSGLFSTCLLKVLESSKGKINYADLFVRTRAVVRKVADDQSPQFDSYGRFDAYSGFLGETLDKLPKTYPVSNVDGKWMVDCGAIHGLPAEPDKPVTLALFPQSSRDKQSGTARAVQIGAQKSEIELDFDAPAKKRFQAQLLSLPLPPIPMYLKAGGAAAKTLQDALTPEVGIELSDDPAGCRYTIDSKDGNLLLNNASGNLIQGVRGEGEENARRLYHIIKQVVRWERSLALENRNTELDTNAIDFYFNLDKGNGKFEEQEGQEVTLKYDGGELRGKVQVTNGIDQELHMTLFYFGAGYGIYTLSNNPVTRTADPVTIWGDDENDYLYLDEGEKESTFIFKLVVSTEKLDDFLLNQDDLELGKIAPMTRAGLGGVKPRKKPRQENEWFTKTLKIHLKA